MNVRFVVVVAVFAVTVPAVVAQSKASDEKLLQAQIVALDRQGWEAWKRNDPSWFQKNTTEDFVSISADGTSTKAEVVKATATDCKVVSFSLEGIKFVRLDKDAVLLTYKATQDAVCGGKKAPPNLQVAVNYVRRNGKWLEALYMQAP